MRLDRPVNDWQFDNHGYFDFLTDGQREHLILLADAAILDGKVFLDDPAFKAWLYRWPDQKPTVMTYAVGFMLHVCYSLIPR